MKIRFVFIILMAAAVSMSTSCQQGGAGSKKVNLKTQTDSVSYALGILIGTNTKSNLDNAPGKDQINLDILAESFHLMIKGEKLPMTAEAANAMVSGFFQSMSQKAGQDNLEKGNAFLEQNKSRQGVTTTESGLQYEIIKAGTGEKPVDTDEVKVHYHGTLIDGTVFDSSVERNEPVTFPVTGVIPGWTEALKLMPVGSKWKIYLPAKIAYGEQGAGGKIGPNSALVFEVELLEIVKKAEQK
jgi:FKBP-type peptidyl-prolyl cis-trans isomerase